MQHPWTRQNHGADGGNEQHSEQEPHKCAQLRAKGKLGRDHPNLYLTHHGIHGGNGEKDEVQQAIQCRHDRCADAQHPRKAPLRGREFTADIGGGVPARVGVVHIDQRHSEGAAAQQGRGLTVPGKSGLLLGRTEDERSHREQHDEQQLEEREASLCAPTVTVVATVGRCERDDGDGGQPQWICAQTA